MLENTVIDPVKSNFTAGEAETSEGNPENSKRDAVDVAPSVPAPEDEAAAKPAPGNEGAAEPTMAEPGRCGPVVQEFDLSLDNFDGSRSLSTGHIANRTENGNYSSRSMPPKRTVCYQKREWQQKHFLGKTLPRTFWGNGNRTAMALLLASDEEAILSKLLVVR